MPWALIALAPACAELPPVPAGVCGNTVVDLDEDCDLGVDPALGDGLRCDACRYVCDGDAQCPAGWGCGADAVCRHASGVYVELVDATFELPAEDWSVGDGDGDGHPDVIGLGSNGARIAYGAGDGRFVPGPVAVTGRDPTGAVIAAELDGDGRVDAILPLGPGLVVLRGQPDRTYEAVAFAPFQIGAAVTEGIWLFPGRVPGFAPEHELLIVMAGADFLSTRISLIPGGEQPIVPIEGAHHPLSDLGPRMPVADLDAPSADDEFALAFRGDDVVTLLRPSRNPFTGVLFNHAYATLSVAPGVVDRGAMFADVDGDGAIDLLVSIADASGADQVYVAWNDGTGVLETPIPAPWFAALAEPGAALPGLEEDLRRWPLAAGDLDGDGRADYVTPNGAFLAGPGDTLTLVARRISAPPWTEAVIAFLDERADVGTPRGDIAVIAGDELGLQLLYGAGGGVFNRQWLDTLGSPALLRSGDLDGDRIADLAFAARAVGSEGEDAIGVVFGNPSGGVSPAVSVGLLPAIERIELGTFRDDLGVADAAGDLVATTVPDATGKRSIAFFGGAPGRVLVSAFPLRDEASVQDPALVVRAGRFLPRTGEDPTHDLICIGDGVDELRLWMIRGKPGARYEPGDASHHDWSAVVPDGAFSAAGALWAAGDVDGDGLDELVGLDATGASVVVRATLDPAGAVVLSSTLGQVDGGAGASRFEVLDGALVIGQVASVNADADPEREIARLETSGVVIGGALVLPAVTGERLFAADVDADGLDDLLIASEDRIRVFLAVPHTEAAP